MAPAPQLLAPRLLGEILGDLGLGQLTEQHGGQTTTPPPPPATSTNPPATNTNVGSTPTSTAPGSPQPTNNQPNGGAQTTPTGNPTNTLPTFGSSQPVKTITDSTGGVVTVAGTPQTSPIGQNAIAVTQSTTDAEGHATLVTQWYAPPNPTGAGSGGDNSSGSIDQNGSSNAGSNSSSSSSSPPGSVVGAAVAIVLVVVAIAGVWMFRRWKARKNGGGVVGARFNRPDMKARGSVASTVLWGATARDSLHNGSDNSSRPVSDASYHSYEDGRTVSSAEMSNSTVRFPSGREYDLDAPFGAITPPPGELLLQTPAAAHTSDSSCSTDTHFSFANTNTTSYHTAISNQSPFGDENSSPFEDPFAIDTKRLSAASVTLSPFADSFTHSAAPSTPDPHRLSAASATMGDVCRPSCDSTIASFPSPPTSPPRTGDIPAPSIFSTPHSSQIFSSRVSQISSAQETIRESRLPRVI